MTSFMNGPKGMSQAARLTLHRVGWKLMSTLFKTCTPFDGTDPKDVSNIMESLIGNEFFVSYPFQCLLI